jgi:hypothetical protein
MNIIMFFIQSVKIIFFEKLEMLFRNHFISKEIFKWIQEKQDSKAWDVKKFVDSNNLINISTRLKHILIHKYKSRYNNFIGENVSNYQK